MIDLGEYLDDETGIELLKRTPSAFLGSCRFKMPKIEGHEDVYEKIFEIMEASFCAEHTAKGSVPPQRRLSYRSGSRVI